MCGRNIRLGWVHCNCLDSGSSNIHAVILDSYPSSNNNNNTTQKAAIASLPSATHPQLWAELHIHVHVSIVIQECSYPYPARCLLYAHNYSVLICHIHCMLPCWCLPSVLDSSPIGNYYNSIIHCILPAGDQPNFQVLSDAEYARQLQEDFSTELGPRGGRRRTGERGRGVETSGAPFGGGSSTVLVSLDAEEREPVQVRQMSMRGRRVLGGPEAAPFWSPTPDSPEHYTRIWNQLPSINSNLQSTNQDLEVQSLLTMAASHRRRALTPPPGYDSLFNRCL